MDLYMYRTGQLSISQGSISNATLSQEYTSESEDFALLVVMITAFKNKGGKFQ